MNNAQLIKEIEVLDKCNREKNLLLHLGERKLKELEFHDRDRDEKLKSHLNQDMYNKQYGNRKFYNVTSISTDYVIIG